MFGPKKLASANYQQFPEIARSDVLFSWEYDHYNGHPVSGLAIYQGRKCWFDAVEDVVERGRYLQRDFLLLELSAEQLEEQEHWHALFVEMVGDHCDYDETGRRLPRMTADDHPWGRPFVRNLRLKPQESIDAFYTLAKQQQRVRPDFSGNRVIGWFSEDVALVEGADEEGD